MDHAMCTATSSCKTVVASPSFTDTLQCRLSFLRFLLPSLTLCQEITTRRLIPEAASSRLSHIPVALVEQHKICVVNMRRVGPCISSPSYQQTGSLCSATQRAVACDCSRWLVPQQSAILLSLLLKLKASRIVSL